MWFWRQVIIALFTGCARETKEHKWLVLRAIAAGWLLHLLPSPLFREPLLNSLLARLGFSTSPFRAFFVLLAILGFGTVAIGWIVSHTSGEHRKAAVIGYSGSSLLYGVFVFFYGRYVFWSHSSIPLLSYLTSTAVPMLMLFIVSSTIGTILVFFGGGLLPITAQRNS